MTILDHFIRDKIIALAKEGRREDGRAPDALRPISLQRAQLGSAEGSARTTFGPTQVLVGVKVDLAEPYPDRPDEGVLQVAAELLPSASPKFEAGPPGPAAIELARIIDRGLRSAGIPPLKELWIEEGKVWGIFVDIFALDDGGNLIDAAGLAAVAALDGLAIPKYADGIVVRETTRKIPLKEKIVFCTFAKVADRIFVDPSANEELAMAARLTLAVGERNVYAMQKAGPGAFTKDELLYAIDTAFEKRKEIIAAAGL